ncbi:MAG TPA: alpha/beta hydrolase [Anaeromyxobacteraceae bacterium]|nr:alpha/beta hydrolase [Anaeromyxobacteraceae bacterium]
MTLLAITLVVLLALVAVLAVLPGTTAPITDELGRIAPESIAELEMVLLGGVPQGLLVRGWNVANPVLLYLHGGPGTSELGMLRAYNLPALERHFTVAVWDQRGAGRSFAAIEPTSGMTVEQLLADTLELVELLRRRFLVWPQILELDLVRQAPELKVPVYFLEGRHDYETPSILAERYFEMLQAPRKALVWFERSAHFVNAEEPDAFNRFFVERLLRENAG